MIDKKDLVLPRVVIGENRTGSKPAGSGGISPGGDFYRYHGAGHFSLPGCRRKLY